MTASPSILSKSNTFDLLSCPAILLLVGTLICLDILTSLIILSTSHLKLFTTKGTPFTSFDIFKLFQLTAAFMHTKVFIFRACGLILP